MSNEFDRFLKEHGTLRQHTTTQTPQQNGVVERANSDIGEGIKAMLSQSGLPNSFWAEAAHTFVHTSNHFPSRALGLTTPYEHFHGKKPSVSHLCVCMY
jgi:transposase InsO family protein